MGINWDPISWVESAASWTGSQISQGADWVGSQIGQAAGWTTKEIEGIPRDVAEFVQEGLHGLEFLTLHFISAVHSGLVDVNHAAYEIGRVANAGWHWVNGAESWFVSHAEHALSVFDNEVVRPAVGAVETFARQEAANVESGVVNVANDVGRLAAGPVAAVEHFVEGAGDWFADEFDSAWHIAYNDAIGPALHSVEVGVDAVAPIILYGAEDIVHTVEMVIKAAEWIVWFGEHTFEDLLGLATGLPSHVDSSVIQKGASYVGDEVPIITGFFRDLIGG